MHNYVLFFDFLNAYKFEPYLYLRIFYGLDNFITSVVVSRILQRDHNNIMCSIRIDAFEQFTVVQKRYNFSDHIKKKNILWQYFNVFFAVRLHPYN